MHKRQVHMTTPTPQRNIFSLNCLRFGRVCIYSITALILLILILLAGAAAFLYKNPEALSKHIVTRLKEHTGIETSFTSVEVTLLPLPALALSGVVLEYEQVKLEIAYATARPAILPLLRGNFAIGHASLLRPTVSGSITSNTSKDNDEPSQDNILTALQSAPLNIPIPSVFFGCDFSMLDGRINLNYGDEQYKVENIQAEIDFDRKGRVAASISLDSAEIAQNKSIMAQAKSLNFHMSGLTPHGMLDELILNLSTQIHVADILEQAKISLAFNMEAAGPIHEDALIHMLDMLNGKFSISGNLMWHKQPIPLVLAGDLRGHGDASVEFINTNLQLDQDKLTLNATLNNVLSKSPSLDGHIAIERLSLTQWFGFARNLPSGLQKTLHEIGPGELQFSIDKKGLKVPMIRASAVGANFKGDGGVSDWSKVVVYLDLMGDEVSLVKAFPETEGVEVTAPAFPYPPLTPIPGSPEAINSSGPTIDYDINIGSKKVITWDLTASDVSFRCIPAEKGTKVNPKNYPNAVLLDFGIGKFYGGRGESKTILFRTDDNRSGYDITAILRNVGAKDSLSILAGREVMGGHISLDASVVSYGATLGQFLINKSGEVSMRVDNGFFTSKEKVRTSFEQFNTAGKFDSAPLTKKMVKRMPEVLRYNGQWRANLKRSDLYAETNLNGILTFVGRTYTDLILDKVSGKSSLTLSPEITGLTKEIIAQIDGKISLNTEKSTTGLHNAHISIPALADLNFSASAELDYMKDTKWSADVNAQTKELSALLAALSNDGISPIEKSAPQNLKMQSIIKGNASGIAFTNLKLELDNMSASGSIHKSSDERPLFDIKLKCGLLDLDKLFSDSKTKPEKEIKSPKPWSLAWLRDYDATGHIDIELLRIYKSNSIDVHIPIDMQKGVLKLKPVIASFYGSPAHIIFEGKALGDALHLQGGAQVEKANMLQLSNDLKLETAIGGKGSLWLSAQGVLTHSKTILPLMDGTWRIKIENGFLQSRKPDGSLIGKPTHISELQDAGPLSNGILYSKNLIIKGPDLNVTGSGKVDLVKAKLDMNLIASVAGIDNISVHYYGDIDNPQRDIHTGSLIVGALSTFGLGIFDVIGGLFEGLFSLFRTTK